MHAVLAPVGADGDVFPHLGLGRALLARGRRVALAAPETDRRRATASGLTFRPLVTAEGMEVLAGSGLLARLRWVNLADCPAGARGLNLVRRSAKANKDLVVWGRKDRR
jgi:UDP:flavonoid glycosyltransferase YjiC (YdhE family)